MKLKIGQITKPVGLKGEVRVYSESDFIQQRFKKDSQVFLSNDQNVYVSYVISSSSFVNQLGKIKLDGVNHIDEAEKLRNYDIFIETDFDQALPNDEYYFYQLKDCDVYQNDNYLGKVIAIEAMPTDPLLVIETESKQFSLPFNKYFVKHVDVLTKRIDVKLIDGFL